MKFNNDVPHIRATLLGKTILVDFVNVQTNIHGSVITTSCKKLAEIICCLSHSVNRMRLDWPFHKMFFAIDRDVYVYLELIKETERQCEMVNVMKRFNIGPNRDTVDDTITVKFHENLSHVVMVSYWNNTKKSTNIKFINSIDSSEEEIRSFIINEVCQYKMDNKIDIDNGLYTLFPKVILKDDVAEKYQLRGELFTDRVNIGSLIDYFENDETLKEAEFDLEIVDPYEDENRALSVPIIVKRCSSLFYKIEISHLSEKIFVDARADTHNHVRNLIVDAVHLLRRKNKRTDRSYCRYPYTQVSHELADIYDLKSGIFGPRGTTASLIDYFENDKTSKETEFELEIVDPYEEWNSKYPG